MGVACAYAVLRTLVMQPFNVPSPSMYPAIRVGDYEFVSKWAYGYSTASLPLGAPGRGQGRLFGRLPARGDIVVFRWPPNPEESWVKRIVALPGETVSVEGGVPTIAGAPPTVVRGTGETGRCWTDGGCDIEEEVLPGAQVHLIALDPLLPANRSMPSVKVPEGMVFVMGDNRDHSLDSRVRGANGGAGLVPLSDLEGRVSFVAFNSHETGRWFLQP